MASMETWDIQETDKKYNNYSPKTLNKSFSQKYLKVDVNFEHYVQKATEFTNFGLLRDKIELTEATSSCGKARGDRFKFLISYAGQTLSWLVLFDSLCPEMGPDFDFSDKSFLQDPEIPTLEKFVPSLVDWDWKDSDSLLKVLTEFTSCYRQHQLDKLGLLPNDRLQVHFASLREKAEIPDEDVEFILVPDVNDPVEAHFLIKFDLNFPKLPDKFSSFCQASALLHVIFCGPTWTKNTPQLVLPSNLLQLFGGNYRIPQLATNRHLGTYIVDLKKRINDKMASIVTNFEEKKDFISTLLFLQQANVIEYDADDFSSITIMVDQLDFHFLIQIKLSDNYPEEPPQTTMHSIYHMTKSDLVSLAVTTVPYPPKSDTMTKVAKLLAHVQKIAPDFKTRCIQMSR